MGFLSRLFLGAGTLRPELVAELRGEGLVLHEDGLTGALRYERFRAPGRYHHGKITPQRIALGISRERVALYGRAKLVDTRFDDPRAQMLEPFLREEGQGAIRIDYTGADVPRVSGVITITFRSPNAQRIVDELTARLP